MGCLYLSEEEDRGLELLAPVIPAEKVNSHEVRREAPLGEAGIQCFLIVIDSESNQE